MTGELVGRMLGGCSLPRDLRLFTSCTCVCMGVTHRVMRARHGRPVGTGRSRHMSGSRDGRTGWALARRLAYHVASMLSLAPHVCVWASRITT